MTAAQLAAEIGIPESTARFYLRRYAAWLPTIGEGRGRRYRREALDVLRFVAEQYRAGLPADVVEAGLAARFPVNAQQQQPTTTTQQQSVTTSEDARALFDALVRQAVRDEISEVMSEVIELRERVARLTALIEQQQQPTAEPQPTATEPPEPPPALARRWRWPWERQK